MMERLSHTELVYWMTLQQIDPIGAPRDDLRTAIAASDMHNLWVSKKKDQRNPDHFMAGRWLKEQHEKSLVERGIKETKWDKKSFFRNLKRWVKN